jgi:hypothetical protein
VKGVIDVGFPKAEWVRAEIKAMRAYTICKDRLDKVQSTLGQYFKQGEEEGSFAENDGQADDEDSQF